MRSRRKLRGPSDGAVPGVDAPVGSSRSNVYGSTRRVDRLRLALLEVLDLDQPVLLDASERVRTSCSSSSPACGAGRLRELERAEGLLELAAHAVERRVRAGGDHRADELEREPDRARLERRQLGGWRKMSP